MWIGRCVDAFLFKEGGVSFKGTYLLDHLGKSPSSLVNTIKLVNFPASYVSLLEGTIS